MMKHLKQTPIRRGFTLVELLVVIVIAMVVLSIAIPRIRMINKERNLREAARVVGSAFANASQRALVDGSAGVRITRNPNLVDAAGTEFAATAVSILRAVPNYSGDQFNDRIVNLTGNMVSIRKPLEQDTLNIVQPGDFISFGGSSVHYRITNVNDNGTLALTLDRGTGNYMPLPAFDASTPATNPSYVIHRRPRVLRSSTVDLPSGNLVDLRYSGFEVSDAAGMPTHVFESDPSPASPAIGPNYTIDVVFKEDGEIDQVFYIDDLDDDGVDEVVSRIPLGPLYLMIAESPLSFDPTEITALTSDPQSLWVAVANNGSSNIGYVNVRPDQTEEDLFADPIVAQQTIQDSRESAISTAATQ